MSIDDALLWLNDRLGKTVAVEVWLERGDTTVAVLTAEGELRHHTQGKPYVLGAPTLDDLHGLYRVGGALLDLSDVRPLEVADRLDDQLSVRLDEHTTLELVEQEAAETTA